MLKRMVDGGGCRHSSVDPSAPTILPPQVQIPSKPSKLLFHLQSNLCYNCHCIVKRTKINEKEAGFGPFFFKKKGRYGGL